jgi:hypothetical protein
MIDWFIFAAEVARLDGELGGVFGLRRPRTREGEPPMTAHARSESPDQSLDLSGTLKSLWILSIR